jgi:hypothetical protein
MSVGYNPKNQLTAEQSLRVQELTISGSDQGLYSLTAYSTGCLIYIREPVLSQAVSSASMSPDGVYLVRDKVDSSNTFTEFAKSSLSIVDSKSSTATPATTSGFNEAGVAVSDQGAILVTGLTALAAGDVLIVKYVVQEHL